MKSKDDPCNYYHLDLQISDGIIPILQIKAARIISK